MADDRLKLLIVIGSIRENRQGERVARWYYNIASRRTDLNMDVELVDLRDYPLPLFAETVSPASGAVAEAAKGWQAKVAGADAFVFVTPEYNRGYPAALKNAIDYLYREWNNKAIGFVSYGGAAGGTRAVEQLRTVAIELQMAPIREGLHIPMVFNAFDDSGQPKDDFHTSRANSMLAQLAWWARALKHARAAG